MPYLIYTDYGINIQDRTYVQLVQNNNAKRTAAEQWAISIVRGKITQKYDVDKEFTDTAPWSPTKVYHVRDRVVIDFPAWVASINYVANVSVVIHSGRGYICKTNNSDLTFTSANWTDLGAQFTVYYVSYPSTCTYQGLTNPATLANPFAPEFSLINIAEGGAQNLYNQGDVVYRTGYTYTATVATRMISHEQLIQYLSYENVPYLNVFPDDTVNNASSQFWGNKTPYTVPAATLPTDATYWTQGDNRTPEIMEAVKDMTIWRLSGLVNCKRQEWEERYAGTLDLLNMYANGTATLLMPRKIIPRGSRCRYGGKIKNNNTY